MRDWQVEQDAWEVEERSERPATIGDVERIALEIAGDNDDRVLRLVAEIDGRLLEIESERHSVARLWEVVDRLRARVAGLEARLDDAEAQAGARDDAHRQDVLEVREAVRDIARRRV